MCSYGEPIGLNQPLGSKRVRGPPPSVICVDRLEPTLTTAIRKRPAQMETSGNICDLEQTLGRQPRLSGYVTLQLVECVALLSERLANHVTY